MKKLWFLGLFLLIFVPSGFPYAGMTVKMEGSEGSGNNIASIDTSGAILGNPRCPYITRITSNVTALVVKNAPGVLHTVTVGFKGSNSNIVLWDNATAASGFILASLDTASINQAYILDEVFKNGLVATTSAATGTVSANADVIVCTT